MKERYLVEEILDLSACRNKDEKLNLLMTFLANRANMYDKSKYNKIALHIEDNEQGLLTFHLCQILGIYNKVTFYIPSNELRKCRFYVRTNCIKPASFLRWFLIGHKKDLLSVDTISNADFDIDSKMPHIFEGFSKEKIREIAVHLYGWIDNKKEYKACMKKALKEAKKEIRAQLKEIKKKKKEEQRNAKNNNN